MAYQPPAAGNVFWLYKLDPTQYQDTQFIGGNPIPVTATIQTPWLHFGDSVTRKDFNEIEVFTQDTGMQLTLEGASNDSEFATPTMIASGLALRTSPFGENKFYIASLPTRDRFYRMTFTSSANLKTVLDAYKFEIATEHRF